ncbi:MAG: NADH-quinone oxidoreductase subunit C [Gammaproteobacteria bacterium]|nr:NADH-quinone oxidoreductase subunit C [Gammaproteobacteria bacterium]
MSNGPSEAQTPHEVLFAYAEHVYDVLGFADPVAVRHRTVKAHVKADRWVEALRKARNDLGLVFFSWLSAIDWSNEVQVGDAPAGHVVERFEILAIVADITEGHWVTFTTDVSKDDPHIESLVSVYRGANWHEREAFEMFGIEFIGHPNLRKIYLPEGFEGNPMRKSFPLLSRELRPWPGSVDVEPMPEATS